ncbi:MAG: hypothetical protein WC674_02505 [Candidatus Krumholzibacteriia bacterium]
MKSASVIGFCLLATSALSAIMLNGCLESKLASAWPEREISIDGKAPEWAGREAYYSEADGFKIGFFNDADYLYVYLATWNRQNQAQILMNGLTVWIDATGRNKQIFGINYPMKRSMPDSAGMPPGMPAGLRPGGRSGAASEASGETSQALLKGMLAEAQGEMIILGPGGEPIASMPAADDGKGGIAAMIDIANRTLIYEMKIPLAPPDSLPFAVNAAPGAMISIGFKVGKAEMPSMKRTGEGPPRDRGGFPGGGMGGPGGGMGGPGGPGGAASSQAFEYWAKVRLAAAPSVAPPKEGAPQERR